jgi:hypothetical protein
MDNDSDGSETTLGSDDVEVVMPTTLKDLFGQNPLPKRKLPTPVRNRGRSKSRPYIQRQSSPNLLESSSEEEEEEEKAAPPAVLVDSPESSDLIYGNPEDYTDGSPMFRPPFRLFPNMTTTPEAVLVSVPEAVSVSVSVGPPAREDPPKNWPHMRGLVLLPVLMTFLNAVDECRCTSELAAANNDNVKGNKWTRLHDVCHGGSKESNDDGSSPRGLLSGKLPAIKNASGLKHKTQEIWRYVSKECLKPGHKVPIEVVGMCIKQIQQYERTKADDKDATKKAKDVAAKLKSDMEEFQAGVGALPPGAKGIEGAGRREHSTNLQVDEPAVFAWANSSKAKVKPPPGARARSPTPTASSAHTTVVDDMKAFTNTLVKMSEKCFVVEENLSSVTVDSDRKRRREALARLKSSHMETLRFLKEISDDSEASKAEYAAALHGFRDATTRLNEMDVEDSLITPSR